MNHRDKLKQIRKTINLIRVSNRDKNRIKISPANSKDHEMAKCRVCYALLTKGFIFFTEVRFEKGGRADILVINPFTAQALIVEILCSEKLEDAKKKAEKYPIETVYIDANDIKLEEIFI